MYESNNSLHNIPLIIKSNIAAGGGMSNFPLRYRPMRNHHDILMSYGEDSQETNLSSPDCDNNVLDILSDMLKSLKRVRRMTFMFMKMLRLILLWLMMVFLLTMIMH